jgi:2-polyprenyl-6-methoxyphenol hydroxylase-like FAD-dependent oxidoreductase
MTKKWDAIIVGARCAGSPLAMLLARKGHKVLVVDKSTFPSDTISTHVVHTPAVAALQRWGVLDEVVDSGCPPIDKYIFDFGFFKISGSPASNGTSASYCPRRIVLDDILVRAAADAGAEVRTGFSVDEILIEDGTVVGIRGHDRDGASVTEHADIVVGADGRHSIVAEAVGAERYNEKPILLAAYYAYFSDLPMDGFEVFIRDRRGFGGIATNDGLTTVVGGWPYAEFAANKTDVEGNFMKMLDQAPEFAERVHAAKRETKFVGAAIENYFRKPWGPGWALVGDAGYNKDSITAQGIMDAFRDAEVLADAIDASASNPASRDELMASYQASRDAHVLPMYEFTCQLATLEPPPPEMQQLFGAVAQSQESMDDFVKMNAGVISPAQFLSEENIGAIMSRAGALQAT